ncbi:uracil-DNA glycosylase [Sandarakinorhabdus sp.]|uniref:uracil-DNA glycosylase n=1 Tax=Sandarakinorhabdus sp. TaxID=1916663 RepID=UPI00286E3079|nr:uracil-DNA glycosylase [Sandarakinorhabdus sp.]
MAEPIKLHESWRAPLAGAFASPGMAALKAFLLAEEAAGKAIFPKSSEWFRALELTPLDRVRVVILGQDPYHGPGQAHGLAFSVRANVKVPPSLANIYKELQSDLGIAPARHGFLEHWASQGVLLLNTSLTVEQGLAASHKGRGWEQFTDAVIRLVAARAAPCAFLLWGNHAQKKADFVDDSRHLVLKAPHPSPLSAYSRGSVGGFFGCRHFSRTNQWLESQGQAPIDWALPSL